MRLRATLAAALVCLAAGSAWAKKAPKDDGGDDDSASSDDSSDSDSGDDSGAAKSKSKAKPKAKSDAKSDATDDSGDDDAKAKDDSSGDQAPPDDDGSAKKGSADDDDDVKKQDLNGHDLGTKKKTNEFERDRFYVDKVDTPKTENRTLIQGSLAETSFFYTESGGNYTGNPTAGNDASTLSRLYTELRYQSDFRHIKGGKWDGRIDARVRLVDQPGQPETDLTGTGTSTPLKTQSGLLGGDEYDLRELWLVRNGDRSDVFIGRQYISDLAAVKIDGVRIDYASSNKFTLLGFAGLYPMRGSRSIETDYQTLQIINPDGTRTTEGNLTGAAGGGAAYRTGNSYGAFGGVVLAPFAGEQPRIFATSNGYWRYGSTLDLYHFAVIDLIGSNTTNEGLTNLSAGLNYKPSPRLRLTASFNRVDTETLNVQAGTYLNSIDTGANIIDNEVYIARIATNEARGSVSAGLGELQRFELTSSLTLRYRPDITLNTFANNIGGMTPVTATLQAEEGVDFYASITDRHSFKDMRLQADLMRTFGIGGTAYDHTELLGLRVSAQHDIKGGQGEWEAEIAYTTTRDSDAGQACNPAVIQSCFGSSASSLLSVGGSVYYRINRNWFGIGSLYVTKESIQTNQGVGNVANDPDITGITGFLRVAYRF
nr:hypothetical protein [Kofleriaceae bacterium]